MFAAEHPDAVLGVVAVDYTPYVEDEVLDDPRATRRRRVIETSRVSRRSNRTWRNGTRGCRRTPSHGEHGSDYRHDADGRLRPLASGAALASVVEGLRTDYPEAFAGVRVPMTALRGEDSAIVTPGSVGVSSRSTRPDIEWVDVADADHYVPEEQPAAVAGAIDRMLRAVAQ